MQALLVHSACFLLGLGKVDEQQLLLPTDKGRTASFVIEQHVGQFMGS